MEISIFERMLQDFGVYTASSLVKHFTPHQIAAMRRDVVKSTLLLLLAIVRR